MQFKFLQRTLINIASDSQSISQRTTNISFFTKSTSVINRFERENGMRFRRIVEYISWRIIGSFLVTPRQRIIVLRELYPRIRASGSRPSIVTKTMRAFSRLVPIGTIVPYTHTHMRPTFLRFHNLKHSSSNNAESPDEDGIPLVRMLIWHRNKTRAFAKSVQHFSRFSSNSL